MNNELYHSDVYLGEDYSDGIKHYKYIKRERRNGKWVYYYKDDLTNKAQKNYKKALNKYGDTANAESTPYYKKKNAKAGLDYSKKVIKKNSEKTSKIAKKYMDAKWYQLGKKKKLKEQRKEIDDQTKRYKGYIKEDKAAIKEASKELKKRKTKTKQARTELDIATDKLRRARQKDKGRKAIAKVLVKGLNTTEKIKKAAKSAPGKIEKAVKNTSNKIEKAAKSAPGKIEKAAKTTVKKVKKNVKSTINNTIDEQRYQEAKIKGYSSYEDTSGKTRLTKATKLGRESMTKYMKKTGPGRYEITKKSEEHINKYRELKAEEDRINAKKKKKKKK